MTASTLPAAGSVPVRPGPPAAAAPAADIPAPYLAGPVSVLAPAGELDLLTAPLLQLRLDEALATRPRLLVLDLRGVRFLDSSAVLPLRRARRQLRSWGGDLTCRQACPAVSRVLTLTGLL